jgi:hypothetical protein
VQVVGHVFRVELDEGAGSGREGEGVRADDVRERGGGEGQQGLRRGWERRRHDG